MNVDDLRDELRRQARHCEAWDLPALPHDERRTTPWRTGGAVLVAAALVVAVLLVVPQWWGAERPVPGADPAPAARAEVTEVGWRETGVTCLALTPECRVPAQVEVERRVLERTDLDLSDRVGRQGDGASRLSTEVTLSSRGGWVLVGSLGADGSARTLDVEVGGTRVPVAPGRAEVLLRVEGAARVPVRLEAASASPSPQLFVATFARPEVEPRSDWDPAGPQCRALSAECATPRRIELDGRVLEQEGRAATVGDGQLGRVQNDPGTPGVERWLMVGQAGPGRTAGPTSALVFLDRGPRTIVDVTRPVLLALPDGTSSFDVRRNGSGPGGTLFTKVYVADD